MARPNILYLHSHDTGRYIQPYGHAVETPALQRFAEQSVLFRQAFCAAPTCSASRAALLFGRSAHSAGMLGLTNRGFWPSDYNGHLANTLKAGGYTTAVAGMQNVAPTTEMIGYDRILADMGATDTIRVDAAQRFLADPPQPFFLSVGFTATHRDFPQPQPPDDPRFCKPPAPLPDTPETRYDMAAFNTIARQLDDCMGSVLAALDEAGLADNTLVICTTDHGIAFPLMKCNMTDHGLAVMLMLRGPGIPEGGHVCNALVSQIDLYPTVCEIAGIDPPDCLEGKSLMPLLNGEADEINDAIFAGVTFHAAYEPMRAVRTRRWKYIRRFDDRGRCVLPNCDDSPSKDVLIAAGWADRPLAKEELYDLTFDPNETNNLVAAPAHAAILEDMRNRLAAWMKQTDDPLLAGPVTPPPTAQLNDPDGLSPGDPFIIAP
ncbi:hypothetical protein LCGC14_0431870 [marine sediment metagenome]|uniref:Sulfatase N-terminal domain-containing protein n=1 Tax=marine sediment metagenome TaxID=412755 RepID=A0A0F9V9V4_9ZZZZ|nr:DUF1501 domain-containing protein [Phycisphaerae bacterium]HDZ44092.1 DUF1501 domain-containing protein [Phycisphaerae bacterium]